MRELIVGAGRRSLAPYIMLYPNSEAFRYNVWGRKHWQQADCRTATVQRSHIVNDTTVIRCPLK